MRASPSTQLNPYRFDLPTGFLREERRLSGRALEAWTRGQQSAVPGFEAQSLTIIEPGGKALIASVAPDMAATFDLSPGQCLIDLPPRAQHIATELRAACDLVALSGKPVRIEASITVRGTTLLLVRGIVLPLRPTHPDRRDEPEQVQAVLSWREVLNRSATDRLRQELGAALRAVAADTKPRSDPFSHQPMLDLKQAD